MALPLLLLVDDSDAMLEFEQAALSRHYRVVTARDGREALEKLSLRPDAVLLDLSMPELNGDEVLARMLADPGLKGIPAIVISSEKERAQACLAVGASAALQKPVSAELLRTTVEDVLGRARQAARNQGLQVLPVQAGGVSLALELAEIDQVLPQPATLRLPGGPSYLCEAIELWGAAVAVLDLARRLGVDPEQPLPERKLLLLSGASRLAVRVDRVFDPEEIPVEQVTSAQDLDGGAVLTSVRALVKTTRGTMPVVQARALIARDTLRGVGRWLTELGEAQR